MNTTNDSRRQFLKHTLVGAAGMAALPVLTPGELFGSAEQNEEKEKKERAIVKRRLGKTGLELPIVSMGVMNADNPELVRAALDAGIVLVDTAHGYQRGRNEEMIGGVIKSRPRDSYMIATKVPGDGLNRETGEFTAESKAGPFVEKFETSLKRLGVSHVEILYLHNVVTRQAALFEEYLNAMVKLKEQGKVRFIGVSTHGNEPEVIRAVAGSGAHDVVLTAYNFRQPHVADVEAAMAEAAKAGLGVVAMKTQAGAYWDKERQKPINMKAALKWALRNENVHTAIPGFTTFDQLQLDLSVMADLTLTPEERKDLEQGEDMGYRGLFCDQCRVCVGQCGRGVDIPAMLRSYMYVYGHRNLAAARDALDGLDLGRLACETCGRCTVNCAMGFDVRDRIQDVARIRHVPEDFVV
jgi:predicted aldo/keto reductase-like oxidoreductase